MIHRISCDHSTFKTIDFESGLNVIIADRTKDSTKKHTRNSLGKSTLVEIIHFCLGADFNKCKYLCSPELNDWEFSTELDILNQRVKVSRNTASPNRIVIFGEISNWPIAPQQIDQDGGAEYDDKTWNRLLGILLFGLKLQYSKEKHTPTFRSLISYFIRREKSAFDIPTVTFRKQPPWNVQVNTAFLLGVSWEIAREFQFLKDKSTALKHLNSAAKFGYITSFVGAISKLEAERVHIQDRVKAQMVGLKNFQVVDQYRDLENNADLLTIDIHSLQNENIRDKRLLTRYESSLEEETAPLVTEIATVYARTKVELPGVVLQRLVDVQKFHSEVVENRKKFLESELEQLKRDIGDRRIKLENTISERAELMSLLESGGALEEYVKLQKSYGKSVAKLEEIDSKIASLKKIEKGKSDLTIDQQKLRQRARLDFDDRTQVREKAISLFSINSKALHANPGELLFHVDKTGMHFKIDIPGAGGTGIDNTCIFAYDLMLAQIWSEKSPSPGFLVHDSPLFDGVDSRQRALALEHAANDALDRNYQYICTLNSDMIPKDDFSEGFELDKFIRLKLTDKEVSGNLTGIRFKVKSGESIQEDAD